MNKAMPNIGVDYYNSRFKVHDWCRCLHLRRLDKGDLTVPLFYRDPKALGREQCIFSFFFSGVTIQSDPFIVGSRAVANCTSSAEQANGDFMVWTNEAGDVVANATSATYLELIFDPVNDSLQGVDFNCTLRNHDGALVVRTLSSNPFGEKELHLTL